MSTVSNSFLKTLLWVFGWIALGLGFIGIFLPLLPTTPFVLLAALCFIKSSPKTHQWLRSHPRFGPSLIDWEERKAISRKAKFLAITMMTLSLTWMWYAIPMLPVKILVTVICSSVSIYILTRPV